MINIHTRQPQKSVLININTFFRLTAIEVFIMVITKKRVKFT